MDLIRTAVSRAKEEGVGPEKPAQAPPPEQKPDAAAANGTLQLVDQITYTRTAVVPLDPEHLGNNRVVSFEPGDPRSGRYDVLRTQVTQLMDAGNLQTLGVTSPTLGCGKTVTAINLAMSMARQFHHTVLLVDFDLKRPTIAQYLGLSRRTDLNDVLHGRAKLEEALINPGLNRLVVLPCFNRVFGSSELMMSDTVVKFCEEIKGRYKDRIVIFDLPPLLETDDTIAFLPQIDCSLLVAAEGLTTPEELVHCGEILQSTSNLGVVYNKSQDAARRYSVYYSP